MLDATCASYDICDVSPEELALYFPEIAARAPGCRFPGCSHIHKPDCAVIVAVDRGEIAASRYDSHVKIHG